jgi:hypothetical protein
MIAGEPDKSSPRSTEQAMRAIGLLFEPGDVIEIRALHVDRGPTRTGVTYAGYFQFDAGDEIVHALASLDGRADGIYVVLNQVNPALIARAKNRLQAGLKNTTSDADIIACRWLYVDVDPVRPAGISASEQERQAALERAIRIRQFLCARGWPEPVYADSGNGAHLLYHLPDLPLDRAKSLVEQCLKALDARFSDTVVKVDTATANASRICKLYGTMARKGDPTPERPHRLSRVLEEPETLTPVSLDALEALAAEVPALPQSPNQHRGPVGRLNSPAGGFDVQQWIDQHRLDVEGPEPWKGGLRWVFPTCPWNGEHRNRSAFIIQFPSGAISAGCLHNGCKDNDWRTLRDLVEPGWRSERYQRGSEVANLEWEPPIPFDQFNLPPFPTSVFPSWLRTFVEAEATATQTPPDLASMLALSVLAAACAKRVRIEVKAGYEEPLNIYTVTALPPGNRKSAVLST